MQLFFWILVFFVVYAYFGYPIVLIFLNRLLPYIRKNHPKPQFVANELPTVDLLIAAYNEEKIIVSKISNAVSLDYPAEKYNIYIASDGSTDGTNNIVKKLAEQYPNVHLLEFPRTGKSGMLNEAVQFLKGDIVVFSDANTEYANDSIKKLISNFARTCVGCVCGRLIYRNPGQVLSGVGESFYWRYETTLKKLESNIGYIAGANGAIYAIRRSLFTPFPPNTINDDFTLSMKIVENGHRSIYDDSAIGYEDVAPSMESEFKRHIRDGAGHYIAIIHLLRLLNPLLGIRSFIYWSHRIIRWAIPFLLVLLVYVNYQLTDNLLYELLFYCQVSFYGIALLGCGLSLFMKLPFVVYMPFYFCNLNLALLLGFLKAVTGRQKTKWDSTERASITPNSQ